MTPTNPLTDRTNVTPTSYDYNGTSYTKQARTDANGNAYTVDVANTQAPAPTSAPVTTQTSTPQTIGSIYGTDQNKASSDYASYLANPDQFLNNQGISVGDLKNKALAELQSSIDSTNAVYGEKLRQAKIQGQGILGSGTAIQARRGLLGSDFGAAQTNAINNDNQQVYDSVEAERAAKIADLMNGAQTKAEQRYADQRASIEGGLKSRLEFLKGAEERSKSAATDAASAFISQGVDPSIMDSKTLNEYAKAHGTTPDAIKTAFTLNTYNAEQATKKAEADRAAKFADTLAAKGIETIGEGQSGYRFNPTTGKYELVASKAKTYAPGTGGSGTETTGGNGSFDISTLSPQAQAYINAIQRGDYGSLDEALKGIGTTKAALALKNEIVTGYNAIAGGKTGTKLITAPEAANFEKLISNIGKIDVSAYGQFDTKGGFFSGIANPTTSAYIDNLLGNLTLEKRSLLKGSGAISDKENQMLADSVSILSRKNISEEAAASALKDIKDILSTKVNNYYSQTQQSRQTGGGQTPATPELENLRSKYNY